MILRKILQAVLIIMLITMHSTGVSTSQPLVDMSSNDVDHNQLETMQLKQPPPQTSPSSVNHSEDPIMTNHISNGGFERIDNSTNSPADLRKSGSGFVNNTAGQTHDVKSGSKAGKIEIQAPAYSSEYSYFRQYFSTDEVFLNQTLDFSFDYNISKANPLQHEFFVSFFVENSTGSYHRLYYELSVGDSSFFNGSSTYTYLLLNSSIYDSWGNNFNRNITADFESILSDVESFYINYISIQIESFAGAQEKTTVAFDDVSIINSTSDEIISNGGFESDGSDWNYYGKDAPSTIVPSTDHVSGDYSAKLNISSIAQNNNGYAYIERYFGYSGDEIIYTHDTMKLNFDYKYSDVTNGGDQRANLYMSVYNNSDNSQDFDLRWQLGSDGDQPYYSNSSSNLYMNSSNFGTRDTWVHESFDLSNIFTNLNLVNTAIQEVGIQINIGDHLNSSIELKIDNFELHSYPLVDPGMEHIYQYTPSNPIPSWYSLASGEISNTSDSHSGNWAANLTASSGDYARISRNTVNLDVHPGIFTDFWWKFTQLQTDSATEAYYELEFNNNFHLHYILGGDESYSNDSDDLYYIVDDFNQTGTWNNLVRNLYTDLTSGFGQNTYRLTQFYSRIDTGSGGDISVLFDDTHFIQDTTKPNINSIQLTQMPMYYQAAVLNVQTDDLLSDITPKLYYRSNASWNSLGLTKLFNSTYSATFPKFDYGTDIDYYINVTDSLGNIRIDDNSTSYYSFSVGDDRYPEISSVLQNPSQPEADQEVDIVTAATDENQLDHVTLHYNLGDTWDQTTMQRDGIIFKGTIPAVSDDTTVQYYVEAVDVAGLSTKNGSQSIPFNYSISSDGLDEASGLIDDIVNQAKSIYENYAFPLGAGSVILLYGLIKVIGRMRGKSE